METHPYALELPPMVASPRRPCATPLCHMRQPIIAVIAVVVDCCRFAAAVGCLFANNRYMFYQMPKDVVQVHAAKELYRRNWRYHKEMRHWYTFESNTYCHFDTREWDKRPLTDDTNGTVCFHIIGNVETMHD